MFVESSFLSATAGPGLRPQLKTKAKRLPCKLLLASYCCVVWTFFLVSFLSFLLSRLVIALMISNTKDTQVPPHRS